MWEENKTHYTQQIMLVLPYETVSCLRTYKTNIY